MPLTKILIASPRNYRTEDSVGASLLLNFAMRLWDRILLLNLNRAPSELPKIAVSKNRKATKHTHPSTAETRVSSSPSLQPTSRRFISLFRILDEGRFVTVKLK